MTILKIKWVYIKQYCVGILLHLSKSKELLILSMYVVIDAITRRNVCNCTEDEREFDYIGASEKGPRHWGEMKKEWSSCKNGHLQSPIDLSCARVKIIPRCRQPDIYYTATNATIINRGHDIAVSTFILCKLYYTNTHHCLY